MKILEHKVHSLHAAQRMMEFLDEFEVEYYVRVESDPSRGYLGLNGENRHAKTYVFNEVAIPENVTIKDSAVLYADDDEDCGCHGHE